MALNEKEEFVTHKKVKDREDGWLLHTIHFATPRSTKTPHCTGGEVTDALVHQVEKEQREAIKDLFIETDDDGGLLLDRSEVKQLAVMLGQQLNRRSSTWSWLGWTRTAVVRLISTIFLRGG
jgi:hypothetical protein